MLLDKGEHAQIAYDDGIHPGLLHSTSVFRKRSQIFIMRINVARCEHARAAGMGIGNGRRQLFQGKIAGAAAQAKLIACKIYGICPEVKRIAQLFHATGRS